MTIVIITVFFIIIGGIIGGYVAWWKINSICEIKSKKMFEETKKELESAKKIEILEMKEKFLSMRTNIERQVNERNTKLQSYEVDLKQKESIFKQKQEEFHKKNNKLEIVRENLNNQLEAIAKKKQEMDKIHKMEINRLESLSGLSAEEIKKRLEQELKEEAKTAAAAYINEIMEEAKLTANREAKKIVVQSIQRVATETAIENSVSIFQIDSDELKGRIIGREGRNIRALEAATGIEIIVDDTPEAIILSGFDPVRREIARLSLHHLVQDGRIHPARIEEVVAKTAKQIDDEIIEVGKRT